MTSEVDKGSFSCELVGWDDAAEFGRILANKIRDSGYSPDIVIAIGRGGYVPARVVCDYLLHEKLTSIKIEHWGIAAEKKDETKVVFPLSTDIRDRSVMIIDDVADTGDTLRAAVDYVSSLRPSEIKTGVLHHKDCSLFLPDFCAQYVKEWRWIVYPWARHEELYGFSGKVLSGEFLSPEDISDKLFKRYGFSAETRDLTRALQDLLHNEIAEESGGFYRKKQKRNISDSI